MITGVVLTHNEEVNIVSCLEHLRPHVDELILVDTSSTDRTIELASPLVDQILTHPHVPNFDSARNLAIPVARFDWLWFVDADEFVSEATGGLVRKWIRERGHEFEAINIPFKSEFCGQWMKHCGWWPGYTSPRVLKRGHFEFSSLLHGGVDLRGREILAPATEEFGIEHRSSRDLAHWVDKVNRYTSTESLQLANAGVVYDWRGAMRYMVRDLWEHYEKHDAKRDGERGWILTWCAGWYRWMSVAKLIDQGCSPEQLGRESSLPDSLDEVIDVIREELAVFRTSQPSFPVGVVVRAPFLGDTVNAVEARAWIKELAGVESRALVAELLPSTNLAVPSADDRRLFCALQRAQRARTVLTLTVAEPELIPPDRSAFYNILRLGERDNVLRHDRELLMGYDEIWLARESQADPLRRIGFAGERLKQVPQSSRTNDLDASATSVSGCIDTWERGQRPQKLPAAAAGQMRIRLEGEFLNGHSFSNINEELARRFAAHPEIALTLSPLRLSESKFRHNVGPLCSFFERDLGAPPQLTIRHSFPPNWDDVPQGLWVHIQPWEFGVLPNDWIAPLRDRVDEIWVMSRYVEQVYRDSGIAADKIKYIPWGVDPDIFRPDAPAKQLEGVKSFRFLYAGGLVVRKGFDRVLAAYLEEFRPDEDVCLVIKAVGVQSFYKSGSLHAEIMAAQQDETKPQILLINDEYFPTQLASLFAACQCVVSAYRGEGFGLPILEAMACGSAAIVPGGGATDDFVDTSSGFILPSKKVPAEGLSGMCAQPTELHVSIDDLRAAMRAAYSNREHTQQLGQAGSRRVRSQFTWDRSVSLMVERFRCLTAALGGFPKLSSNQMRAASTSCHEISPVTRHDTYGRLGKSLLVQMACGPHLDLLHLTRAHHRDYATSHGMDYWDVAGLPSQEKRPGWGKVALIIAAIRLGYDCVIWLDADAVIRRPNINLANLITSGIGMVRHPSPDHWNTGMIVSKSSALVERFWGEVDGFPENESSWMEQVAVNELASQPHFAQLLQSLDLRYNSVPGFASADDPVIIAGHGAPLEKRKEILRLGLIEAHSSAGASMQSVARREDLALLLNELGLTGEGVEVGVHRGEFADQILQRWNGKMLHLVDPWRHLPSYHDVANVDDAAHDVNFHLTCARLVHFGNRVRIHRTLSLDAAKCFKAGSLDFAYLDANHAFEAVCQDLDAWFPKVRRGGILAGHDFLDGTLPEGEFGVASAVRMFAEKHGVEIGITDDPPWRSWYLRVP